MLESSVDGSTSVARPLRLTTTCRKHAHDAVGRIPAGKSGFAATMCWTATGAVFTTRVLPRDDAARFYLSPIPPRQSCASHEHGGSLPVIVRQSRHEMTQSEPQSLQDGRHSHDARAR